MNASRPVVIAQISDLHCGSQYHIPSLATRVVDEINELSPDALVVTGDLTDMGFRQEFKVAHRLISRMDVEHVAQAVVHMAALPLETNVLFMTVMATKMPFVGRG